MRKAPTIPPPTTDNRERRVEELRAEVEAGTYVVDPEKLSQRIMVIELLEEN